MNNKTTAILVLFACIQAVLPASARAQEKDYAPFPNPDAGYVTDLADLLTQERAFLVGRSGVFPEGGGAVDTER